MNAARNEMKRTMARWRYGSFCKKVDERAGLLPKVGIAPGKAPKLK